MAVSGTPGTQELHAAADAADSKDDSRCSRLHTALIPWNSWVHHSLGRFLDYDPALGFTVSDFEDALATNFFSLSIYTWIDKVTTWAQQPSSPFRYCLITMQDPFNKASLKCTGHSGALFFDAVTVVAAHYRNMESLEIGK